MTLHYLDLPPPPCWKTKMPIKLTKNPAMEMINKRSCLTSGGSNARCTGIRGSQNNTITLCLYIFEGYKFYRLIIARTCMCTIFSKAKLTSIASEKIKNEMKRRNNALTKPAMTSARTYLYRHSHKWVGG